MSSPFVEPAYGVRSLSDALPAVAQALGHPLPAAVTQLQLPEAPAYVVLLVDGMGAELLRRHAHAAPFLSELLETQQMATAGVPTTTVTSLTSLGTGLAPGTHGMVGYTARIPGTDRLLNGLQWDSEVDPVLWQPHETVFGRLAEAGVRTTVVNKRDFATSALTVASNRGAGYVGADGGDERLAAVVEAAAATPSLTYVYDSDLDSTGHKFGVASWQWLQQLSNIDEEAERMRELLPADTRMLILADHGMVDSPPESRVDIDEVRVLRHGLTLFGGEARFRHLYCRPGAVDDVVATWREVLGERAEVLTRYEAVRRGWFGSPVDSVLPRLGDVMVACRDDLAILSSHDFPKEGQMIGMHGSLTPVEMLIPMLVV